MENIFFCLQNVVPESSMECGPYEPISANEIDSLKMCDVEQDTINYHNHDTIGLIAIDENGNIAAGTSTNGLKHKIPGYNVTYKNEKYKTN